MSKFLDELFDDIEIVANVLDVYDGDTITIETNIPNAITSTDGKPFRIKLKCRLLGYDSPEIRTRDDNEKRMGYISKDVLSNKILNKEVRIKTQGLEKYGRLLGTVFLDDENINEFMVGGNYGYIYGGKNKPKVKYHDDNTFEINGTTYKMSR